MEPAPPGLGGAMPVSSSQSARKEWRAHSYRSNAGEDHEHVKLGQSAERAMHEVGTRQQDVDFCSIVIDEGAEMNDDVLQQKLQEITRQREELQQMEIELQARAIARSEILDLQNSFEVQLKENIDINNKLKEQLHEKEQHILDLERKLEERERELRAVEIDTEAAWAKDDLLREQNKELASFRRERDSSDAERTKHLSQIHELQEHIHDKESKLLALQEQHQVAQETILFKDEQLREAQSWITRVQEMDALQSTTNQSLQAELRDRTEQFNQYWIGLQRQFVEMERHHMQAIQQLQLELAEARGKSGIYKDGGQVTHENSMDSSSYNGNQFNVKDGGKANGHLQFTSNASVEGTSSFVSAANSSSKTDLVSAVPLVPSSVVGLNGFIPPSQMASLHPYVMNPLRVPHAVTSTNSPILQSQLGHYQQMSVIQNHHHWQNQQVPLDISQMPTQTKNPPPQTEQDNVGSDAHYSFNLPGEVQIIHQENHNSRRDQQQVPGALVDVGSNKVQSIVNQKEEKLDPPHLDSAREHDTLEKKESKLEDIASPENQSEELVLKFVHQRPTSSTMLSIGQSAVNSNGITSETTSSSAPVSSYSMPGKPSAEPNLLDERSLLACIVRAIPAGSDGRIRISTTLPNRLGKMLAPLHWHDYKKQYGKLDDFVAHHPELFVIEGDFIHLREGAQQIISATAAFAKVAAATASHSAPYASLLPSVAVTPVAQVNRQKVTQSTEPKPANSTPAGDSASVTNAGNSNDKHMVILTKQDDRPNGVRFNIVQGLSDVIISNKLKNVPEANGSSAEFKSDQPSLQFMAGNSSSLDRSSLLPPSQNKGLKNGRHSFVGKQQGRVPGFEKDLHQTVPYFKGLPGLAFFQGDRLVSSAC